jgi:cytochrome b561
MSAARQAPGFTRTMQVMHWTTAALLFGSYPAAWMVANAAGSSDTPWFIMVHRSCGVTVLLLTVTRLAWRQRTRIPPLPAGVPWLLRFTARAGACSLYALLILQPLLGLIGSMLYGDRIVLFGITVLPVLLPGNRTLARQVFQTHGLIAVLLLAVIGVHVTAALYHHFVRKDDVLAGMLPGAQYPPNPATPNRGLPS